MECFFFAKVKMFRFWLKTMDYNKAFWPKSRSFFVVLLLQNGRCYEAETCAILLLAFYVHTIIRRNYFPQGFIATLKDSYGFIESEEHDCELFFPFR